MKKMFGTLPAANEAPLTSAESFYLSSIGPNGTHFQTLGMSSVLRRLEMKGRVKMGRDLIVRTTEQHESIFGKDNE